MKPSVLILSPEPPWPMHGGGAYRVASLVHYFARFAHVDLVLISDSGTPALLPAGLIRSQTVIGLREHGKSTRARYIRNARRAIQGVPPLIDRLSGLEDRISHALAGKRYDLGVVEHFWCAPYLGQLQECCDQTVLDLHNVESVLHGRCAAVTRGLVSAGHRRFAEASRRLEADLLPRYSIVLATSEADSRTVHEIAPKTRIAVYPNALPRTDAPGTRSGMSGLIVFSGNFEYHPNVDAVRFLTSEIWPVVRKSFPNLRLRLVGRGDTFIRGLLRPDIGIEATGPVPDALAEIAAADLVVAPLRAGSGTRVKILEAWASARAVLATSLAAEGLAAHDGHNIVLADNATNFIAALIRLLDHPAERCRLAGNGRAAFEQNYTWETAWLALDANLQVTRTMALNRYTV